jgi:ActR/RegA family two-component response regulator
LVTAFVSLETSSAAVGVGMRQVLAKPVDFALLLSLIEEILGKPG